MSMQAQYLVKVQAIRSTGRTNRYYVFVPLPLAAAIGLEAGEQVQWTLEDRNTLAVKRFGPRAEVTTNRKRRNTQSKPKDGKKRTKTSRTQ